MHHRRQRFWGWSAAGLALIATVLLAAPQFGWSWNNADFTHSPLVAYPFPRGRNDIIGTLESYTIRKGDTLLDVGRWFTVSAAAISDANDHMDWWAPPVGKTIILPTEHILPAGPHSGIVVNVPELRLYYYPAVRRRRGRGKLMRARYGGGRVVYTFPVGLGRFDWRTPIGKTFHVTAKEHNPPWIVPNDIYKEHMERDGYAVHRVAGGSPENPEGHWRLDLNMPEYAIHGTNDPWGVGMEVSHGCIRLYPEDIDRLWHMVPVGTKGVIVYEPVKYGWRGNALYVEVHEDLYGLYPGLWRYALNEARRRHLLPFIDRIKLEKAVEEKTGIPTYVMRGPKPPSVPIPATIASSVPLPPSGSIATAPDADTSAPYNEASATAPATRAPIAPSSLPPAASELPPSSVSPRSEASDGIREDPIAGTPPKATRTAPAAGMDKTRGWERVPAGALPIE